MSDNNRILTAGAVVAAGLMIAGGAAAAQAATSTTPAATGYGAQPGYGVQPGYGAQPGYGDGRRHGGHDHTTVTGDEAAKVRAAVKAKDATLTVEQVRKDPDGSYDAMGTKAGQHVMVEVSKDLATVEVRTGGPGGHGGHGGRDRGPGQAPTPGASAASPAGYAV